MKYLNEGSIPAMLHFPRDVQEREVEPNHIFAPVLLRYYLEDWHSHNQ